MNSHQHRHQSVLVLGGYHSAIPLTRSLSRSGYRVIVGYNPHEPSFAEHSRFASETWHHPSQRREQTEFVNCLSDFLSNRDDVSLVFPVSDTVLLPLAHHYDEISKHAHLVMLLPNVIETCEKKIELMRLCTKLGIHQEAYAWVENREELFEEADRIGFPCVVKAPDSQRLLLQKKALIFSDRSKLQERFTSWPDAFDGLIVQRMAPGSRYDSYVAARQGEILFSLQTRLKRTDRADGTGISVDGLTVPRVDEMHQTCEALVSTLNMTGVAYFQFLFDEPNRVSHLLEINPRLGVNYNVVNLCGVDLPTVAVKLALGAPIAESELPASCCAGRRYAWTFGDLAGLRRALTSGDVTIGSGLVWLFKSFLTFIRADKHVSWEWSDPKPTLMNFAGRRLRRNTHRAG